MARRRDPTRPSLERLAYRQPRKMRTLRLIGVICVVGAAGRPCIAQQLSDVHLGARVRVSGDRATNDGLQRFSTTGVVVAADSARLILQPQARISEDTVSLIGVRRLDLYKGRRSRLSMSLTGATLGGIAGVITWFIARQTLRPSHSGAGQISTEEDASAVVRRYRNAIPLFVGTGALIGAVVGPEQWVRVPVPQSAFPQAR